MTIVHLIILIVAAACSLASGFTIPYQGKSSSALKVVALDPSLVSDPNVLTAVGAAVAAAVAAAVGLNDDKRTRLKSDINKIPSKPEPIDVSIPYNAAAALAYNAYEESAKKGVTFDDFLPLYEAQMVAEVKVKVQQRKIADVMAEMQIVLEACEKHAVDAKDQVDALIGAKEVKETSF